MNGGVLRMRNCDVRITEDDKATIAYPVYCSAHTSVDVESCRFSSARGYGFACHGGDGIAYQCWSLRRCEFGSSYRSGDAAIEIPDGGSRSVASVTDCVFNVPSTHAISVRGSCVISRCTFTAGSIEHTASASARLRIYDCEFQGAIFNDGSLVSQTWIERCHFTPCAARPHNVLFAGASPAELRIKGCTFEGFTDAAVIHAGTGLLILDEHHFANTIDNSLAWALDAEEGGRIRGRENSFAVGTNVCRRTSRSLGWVELRRAINPVPVASGTIVIWDCNYHAARVTGSATMTEIRLGRGGDSQCFSTELMLAAEHSPGFTLARGSTNHSMVNAADATSTKQYRWRHLRNVPGPRRRILGRGRSRPVTPVLGAGDHAAATDAERDAAGHRRADSRDERTLSTPSTARRRALRAALVLGSARAASTRVYFPNHLGCRTITLSTMATELSAAVATFSDEVRSLARARVSTRRRGRDWEISFQLRSPRTVTSEGFSFDAHLLRIGRDTVKLADASLRIIRVALVNETVRLLIQEVTAVLVDAALEDAKAEAALNEATRILRGAEHDPLRKLFARRALRGIGRMAAEASAEAIAAAAEAPTDTEVVVRALEQPETLSTLAEDDPLMPAKLRGLRERERLLSLEGGTWDAEQVARHLHLTRQGVNRRRRAGTLLAIDVGRRGYRYPAWQFVRAGTLPGLEQTLKALREHDAWMQLSFMLNANVRLNDASPLEVLRSGRGEEAEAAARAFGEHGAA
jgi:hypothetical protein